MPEASLPVERLFDQWWETRCTPRMKEEFKRAGLTREGVMLIYMAGANAAVGWFITDYMQQILAMAHPQEDAISLTKDDDW